MNQSTTSANLQAIPWERGNQSLISQARIIINNMPESINYTVKQLFDKYQSLICHGIDIKVCQSNIATIKNNDYFGKVDLNHFVANSYNIIQLRRINYTTIGLDGKLRKVSGTIITPNNIRLKGVVLYFHPSIVAKLNAPSIDLNNRFNITTAWIFATQGYVVLIPDYIGMGIDLIIPHPYVLYPTINAIDGANMLLNTIHYFKIKKLFNNKIPLYVTGYSEGSSYALWFSKLYQQNSLLAQQIKKNYQLKKTVAIDGAYNLSTITMPFFFASQHNFNNDYQVQSTILGAILKPTLMTLAFSAVAYYENLELNNIINLDFYQMNCTLSFIGSCDLKNKNYNLYQLTLNDAPEEILVKKYFNAANFKLAHGALYSLFSDSINPLINKNPKLQEKLSNLTKAADNDNWHSDNPVTLVSLRLDSIVPVANSQSTYSNMLKLRSTHLSYLEIDNNIIQQPGFFSTQGLDHIMFMYYSPLIALNEFNNTSN